jgi:hypothetical protein
LGRMLMERLHRTAMWIYRISFQTRVFSYSHHEIHEIHEKTQSTSKPWLGGAISIIYNP